MVYTGNIFRDLEVTLIDLVAETVAEDTLVHLDRQDEVYLLSKKLVNRMKTLYKVNRKFGESIEKRERSKTGARDQVYAWMKHWAKAYLVNPELLDERKSSVSHPNKLDKSIDL